MSLLIYGLTKVHVPMYDYVPFFTHPIPAVRAQEFVHSLRSCIIQLNSFSCWAIWAFTSVIGLIGMSRWVTSVHICVVLIDEPVSKSSRLALFSHGLSSPGDQLSASPLNVVIRGVFGKFWASPGTCSGVRLRTLSHVPRSGGIGGKYICPPSCK